MISCSIYTGIIVLPFPCLGGVREKLGWLHPYSLLSNWSWNGKEVALLVDGHQVEAEHKTKALSYWIEQKGR